MSLFTRKVKEKKSTLEFHIDVENVTEDEFIRLKEWIKENIPSVDRFTPTWNPDDNMMKMSAQLNATMPLAPGNGSNGAQQSPAPIMGPDTMAKIRFRFRHEEHAMAFKLII